MKQIYVCPMPMPVPLAFFQEGGLASETQESTGRMQGGLRAMKGSVSCALPVRVQAGMTESLNLSVAGALVM